MELKKAIGHLQRLRTEGPDDLTKYAQVHALLANFREENTNLDGSMIDAYIHEKIGEVENSFSHLCDETEQDWEPKKLRENLRTELYSLERLITEEGELRGPGRG